MDNVQKLPAAIDQNSRNSFYITLKRDPIKDCSVCSSVRIPLLSIT